MDTKDTITQSELTSFVKAQGKVADLKASLLDRLTQGATVEPGMLKAQVTLGAAQSTSWRSLAMAMGATASQVADHTRAVEERSRSLTVGLNR